MNDSTCAVALTPWSEGYLWGVGTALALVVLLFVCALVLVSARYDVTAMMTRRE